MNYFLKNLRKLPKVFLYLASYAGILISCVLILIFLRNILSNLFIDEGYENQQPTNQSESIEIPESISSAAPTMDFSDSTSETNISLFTTANESDTEKNNWKVSMNSSMKNELQKILGNKSIIYRVETLDRSQVFDSLSDQQLKDILKDCNQLNFQEFLKTRPGVELSDQYQSLSKSHPLAIKQFISRGELRSAILKYRKINESDWIYDDWNGISQPLGEKVFLELECVKIIDQLVINQTTENEILKNLENGKFNIFFIERENSISPFSSSFRKYASHKIINAQDVSINYLLRGDFLFPYLQVCGSFDEVGVSLYEENYKKNSRFTCVAVDIIDFKNFKNEKHFDPIYNTLASDDTNSEPAFNYSPTPIPKVILSEEQISNIRKKLKSAQKEITAIVESAQYSRLKRYSPNRLTKCSADSSFIENNFSLLQCGGRPVPIYFSYISYCYPESDNCSELSELDQLPTILKDKGKNYKYKFHHINEEDDRGLGLEIYFFNEQVYDGFSLWVQFIDGHSIIQIIAHGYTKERFDDHIKYLKTQK